MELMEVFKAILALAFVLGLLLLSLWAMKYMQANVLKHKWVKKLNQDARLKIVETKKIDLKNSLVIVEKDNMEHLLLVGQGQSLLIESKEKGEGRE